MILLYGKGTMVEYVLEGFYFTGGRVSSVGIATRYGLDGPGIESAPVQTWPGPHRVFPGGKTAGAWR